jgi:N-acetylneuraminic acid mutarotase
LISRKSKTTFVLTLFLALLPPAIEGAEAGSRPSPRFGHSMVYDPVNERVLLFGGAVWDNRYTFFEDLWSYDPVTNTWIEVEHTPGPSGRFNYMLAYVSDRHQLFLFGGWSEGDRIGDTWTYDIDANEWTQLHPQDSPYPRSDAAIAYDEENGVIVLFDGYCQDDRGRQDTWVYDFGEGNWIQMNPEEPPKSQYGHYMIYDSQNQQMVMYGGHWSIWENGQMVSHGYSDGVWTYDYPSDTWTKVDTASSLPQRYWHTIAYDEDRGKMVVFGGSGATTPVLDDTWLYDLSTNAWERLDTDEKPPERENSALVYDPFNGKFILFGGLKEIGEAPLNDLWLLDIAEGTWREADSEPVSTDGQEGPTEGEGNESSQTGIPGFPVVSLVLGLLISMVFLSFAAHRRL